MSRSVNRDSQPQKDDNAASIATQNPMVDSEQLQSALDALQALEKQGLPRAGYGVAAPFSGASKPKPVQHTRSTLQSPATTDEQ